jgi:hypothetical protein
VSDSELDDADSDDSDSDDCCVLVLLVVPDEEEDVLLELSRDEELDAVLEATPLDVADDVVVVALVAVLVIGADDVVWAVLALAVVDEFPLVESVVSAGEPPFGSLQLDAASRAIANTAIGDRPAIGDSPAILDSPAIRDTPAAGVWTAAGRVGIRIRARRKWQTRWTKFNCVHSQRLCSAA